MSNFDSASLGDVMVFDEDGQFTWKPVSEAFKIENSAVTVIGRIVNDPLTGPRYVPTPWNERMDLPVGLREALTLIATR